MGERGLVGRVAAEIERTAADRVRVMETKGTSDPACLAPLFQRSAELCRRQMEGEPSTAMQWYLKGMADAHGLDALRAREVLSPTLRGKRPHEANVLVQAYKALLDMLAAVSGESGSGEPSHGEVGDGD